MNTEIIVALIASGGGLLGSLVGERTYKLEETEAVMQEQIRVANHRIADLEKQMEG